jgi:outer membrane immunogenic protein
VNAADMPVKARPIVADPPYSWNDWYVGGNAGYSRGKSGSTAGFSNSPGLPIVAPVGSILTASTGLNGGVVGGQIGRNWQIDRWVAGLETDIQWSGEKGTSNFLCAATAPAGGVCMPGATFLPTGTLGASLSVAQSIDWFGTLRARVGFTPMPTWMVYGTGGLAYGHITSNATFSNTLANVFPAGTLVVNVLNTSTTKTGWTIGGGVEGRLWANWTGKIEYLRMDLGSISGTIIAVNPGIATSWSSRITDNIVRVGLNYQIR